MAQWKLVFFGILLLGLLIALSIFVFHDNGVELIKNILYWLIITLAVSLFIFVFVLLFPALQHIFKWN
jgi:hypothetical protein